MNPAGRRPPALTRLPPHPRDPATTRRNLTGAGARATRAKLTSQTQNRTPLADRIHADQLLANAPCPTRKPPHTRDLDLAPLQLGRRRRTCRPTQAQASQPSLGGPGPNGPALPLPRPPLGFPSSRARHHPPAGSGPDPSSDSDTHRRQPPEDHRSGPRVPHSRPGIPAVNSSEDSKDTQRTGNSKKGEQHAARKDPTSKVGAFASAADSSRHPSRIGIQLPTPPKKFHPSAPSSRFTLTPP